MVKNVELIDVISLERMYFKKIEKEIINAMNQGIEQVIKVFKQYNMDTSTLNGTKTNEKVINRARAKILVLAGKRVNENDLLKVLKQNNIPEYRVEFIFDYAKMDHFNFEKLRNSLIYTDILIGDMPHSVKGKDDYSSFIVKVENNSDEYPHLIKLQDSNQLKITKTNFKQAIPKLELLKYLD